MASCPLGFGSPGGGGAQLTHYHCPLCRGLLHEPVTTSCSHTFCGFCIRKARDCPVCGADIDSTQPDTTLGETIQKLLVGHARILAKATGMDPSGPAGCPASASTAATAPTAKPPTPAATSSGTTAPPAASAAAPLDLPSVLLQLSLQSLAGGNPEAAFARLELCADTLCSNSESKSGSSSNISSSATGVSDAEARGAAAAPARGAPTAPAPPGSQAPASPDASTEGPPSSAPPQSTTSVTTGQPQSTAGATTAAPDAPAGPAPAAAAAMARRLAAARTSPETASRLGAVLGCQADCCRRLGDGAAAQALYGASLACLDPWVGRSKDVDQAVGVTHNKLGDLLYLQGRLREALPHYERALGVRRGQLAGGGAAGDKGGGGGGGGGGAEGSAGAGEEEVHDACDLAASLCKVADLLLSMCSSEGGGEAEGEVGAGGEAGGAGGRGDGGRGAGDEREQMVERARGLVQEAREVLAARGPGSAGAGEVNKGEEGKGAGRGQLPPAAAQRYGRVAAAADQLAERLQHVCVV